MVFSRISIVGTGNMAFVLSKVLCSKGLTPVQIISRPTSKTISDFLKMGLKVSTSFNNLLPSDLTIIAVSDNAIREVSDKLQGVDSLVVHTSGTISETVLSNHKRFGIFYPMQTMSRFRDIDLSEIPIFVQANAENDLADLQSFAKIISNNIIHSTDKMRQQIHLAAVFASNFSNVMYSAAYEYLNSNGISFDLMKKLIMETAEKACENNPIESQTGPARRNDLNTIELHKKMLEQYPNEKAVYELLTNYIISKYHPKNS